MPNRRRKFATIYCARSPEIPFLPRALRRDLEADCPYYCGQKMSRAQGMATTSYCGKFYLTEVRKFLSIFP
jgi:hypothetical protein